MSPVTTTARTALAIALLALAAGAWGATSVAVAAGDPKAAARETARRLLTDLRARDWRSVCALGTRASVRRIERESGGSCPEAFAATASQWSRSVPPVPFPRPSVSVRGRTAVVTYRWRRDGVRWESAVHLARTGATWRADLYRL